MASNLPVNLVVEFNDLDNVQNYNEKFYLARNGMFKQTLSISNAQGFVNVDISNLAPGVEKVMVVPVDTYYPNSKVTVRFNVDTGTSTYDIDLPTKKLLLWTIHQDFVTDLAGLQIMTESITPMNVIVYFFSTAVDPDTQQNDAPAGVGIVTSVNGRDGDVTLTKNDVGLSNVNNTADTAKPVSVAQQQALATKQSLSEKGQANGYASLDATGKVPLAQIPPSAGAVWGSISGTIAAQTDLQTALAGRKSQVQNQLIVQKNPGAQEFLTIADAVAAVVAPSASNRYEILVGPGVFQVSAGIVLPDYVSLRGSDIQSTIIEAASPTFHLIQWGFESEVSFVTLRGTGATYAALFADNVGDYVQAHKVSISDCGHGILVSSSSVDTYCYLEYVDVDGVFVQALRVEALGTARAYVNAENFYAFAEAGFSGSSARVSGTNAELNLLASGFFGVPTATGILVAEGGHLNAQGVYLNNQLLAIKVENTGVAPSLNLNAVDFRDCVKDIDVLNPTTTGYMVGYSEHEKTTIANGASFFIAQNNPQIVTVSQTGGDHTSVSQAVATIQDASPTKPYLVQIGPGVFQENEIVMKPHVHLSGSGNMLTVLTAAVPGQILLRASDSSSISNLFLTGATGVGGYGIYYEGQGTGIFEVMHVQFGSNATQCRVFANTAKTTMVLDSCGSADQAFTHGFVVDSNPGFKAEVIVFDFIWRTSTPPYPTGGFIAASGADSIFRASNVTAVVGSPTGKGLTLANGASAFLSACNFSGFATALEVQNIGVGPQLHANGVSIESCTQDIDIAHPAATGSFQGVATASKVFVNPATTFPLSYQDTSNGDIVASGVIKLGFSDNSQENVSTLIVEASTMGVLQGGALSDGGGLLVAVASGYGYVDNAGVLKQISWNATGITLPANVTRYVFFNSLGVLTSSASLLSSESNIILGRVATNATGLELIEQSAMHAEHTSNVYDESFRKAFGPIYASGSAVSEHTTPFKINVTSGTYYFSTNKYLPAGGTQISFTQYYQNGLGGWNRNVLSTIDHAHYDDSSGTLQNLTASYYAKHALYLVGDGANEKYFSVLSQAQYATLLEAENADLPFPPEWISDAVVLIASIIVRQGAANITEIRDERPRAGFKSAGTSSSSDHQSLSNRTDANAHPQYLRVNGASAMTGDLDLGLNDIVNAGTINGVTITDLTARLIPGGADELPTAAPSTSLDADTANSVGLTAIFSRADHLHDILVGAPVSIGTSNSAGTGAPLARADHIHDHGSQSNPGHHAIATSLANGFMSAVDKAKLDLVSTLEIGYLSGVTSGIQTQLNAKQASSANLSALAALATFGVLVQTSASNFTTRTLTAASARLSITNGDGIASNPTLDVVESNLLLSNIGGTLAVGKGGTGSTTPLANNRVMVSSGGAIVEASAITANRALVSGATGLPQASAVTDTELGHVAGVTSAIQTQLNAKQPLAAQLSTLAAYNSNGLFTQTATGSYTGRTLVAGSSKVSVANGDGVAGNPSIDLNPGNITLSSLGGMLGAAQFDLVKSGNVLGNFGPSNQESQLTSTTVTAAWVTANSRISASIVYAGTSDHDGDDSLVEGIQVHVGNVVPGVSFDLVFFAPLGAFGDYRAHYLAY